MNLPRHWRSQGKGGARCPPLPIEMPSMTKTTKFSFFLISFFFGIFSYYRLILILMTKWPEPLKSNFSHPIKCIMGEKFRVFLLKVATSGPHLINL